MRAEFDTVYAKVFTKLCDRWLSMSLDVMHFPFMFNQIKTEFIESIKEWGFRFSPGATSIIIM